MELIMDTILKLYGASLACVLLVVAAMSANANVGRGDPASAAVTAGTNSVQMQAGEQVALNPQPLPPGRAGQRQQQHQFRSRANINTQAR
jgi:hypothetical protein